MTIRLKKWRQRHWLQGSQLAEREAALLGLHLNHKQIRADLQGMASSYCIWPLTSARSTLGMSYPPPWVRWTQSPMTAITIKVKAQKIMGCILTYFLKHDALLLQWHAFAMSRYLHPEDCNLPCLEILGIGIHLLCQDTYILKTAICFSLPYLQILDWILCSTANAN